MMSCKEDEEIIVSRQRDRMPTPKLRPLLPASRHSAFLLPPKYKAKSLFQTTFRVTPFAINRLRDELANSLILDILQTGGGVSNTFSFPISERLD